MAHDTQKARHLDEAAGVRGYPLSRVVKESLTTLSR